MKKFILFAFLTALVSVYVHSQSLTLASPDGTPISNNGNIVVAGNPMQGELICNLKIGNVSANSASVMLKKVEINCITGTENSFCWGVNCYPPFVFVSPDPEIIPAGTVDSISFSGHYVPNTINGTSIVRYVFYLDNQPNDSVCVNTYFQAFPDGVNESSQKPVLSAAFPNPANNQFTFNYSISSGNAATLMVRDVLGATRFQTSISGSGKLSVNTSELQNGIYFYSLVLNGKTEATRKLFVQH